MLSALDIRYDTSSVDPDLYDFSAPLDISTDVKSGSIAQVYKGTYENEETKASEFLKIFDTVLEVQVNNILN